MKGLSAFLKDETIPALIVFGPMMLFFLTVRITNPSALCAINPDGCIQETYLGIEIH